MPTYHTSQLNKQEVQDLLDIHGSIQRVAKLLNVHRNALSPYIRENKISYKPKIIRKLSPEAKIKASLLRKEFWKNNPDKHPWRHNSKFKSEPCEKVKEFLKTLNMQFIEEFQPNIDGRSFSIDIALPEKLIAIEINGNQHYERDGNLKSYYLERQTLLEQAGWTVYQVHYSCCFNINKWQEFFLKIQNLPNKVEFDYFNYIPKQQEEFFCKCGKEISPASKLCRQCFLKEPKNPIYHPNRPDKKTLETLVATLHISTISKNLKVSHNTVENWCKSYNLNLKDLSPYSHKNAKPKVLKGFVAKSKYLYVTPRYNRNRWLAMKIDKLNQIRIFCKTFKTELEAAQFVADFFNSKELILRSEYKHYMLPTSNGLA